jgi:hypothetical protein
MAKHTHRALMTLKPTKTRPRETPRGREFTPCSVQEGIDLVNAGQAEPVGAKSQDAAAPEPARK